ncbi:MAG: DNA repair protein RecO [Gammaproteobacteria bacterium]|nr:DNA repair protein RecO [Gammaproteobacteria bacterium]
MARIQLEPAYVLHSRPFRETSLIVEAFTREYGRIAVVARGAKSARSRWRNVLQPFRPLLLSWNQKSDLGTLTAADQVASPPALQGQSLYCGIYLNELLMRLSHRGDPHIEVFERYRHVLSELASELPPQPLLRVFEKHLLEAIGYAMLLDRECKSGVDVLPQNWYDYRPDSGPVLSAGPGRNRISGAALLALHAENLQPANLPELRMLMRSVIGYHLGGKPLASLSLFTN